MGERPFFSIGVSTYNRKDALKRCLESILGQTYRDFEVIVGNDYPLQLLSHEVLGIDDSRIRFVNHPQNLGEFGNLKTLLGMANGRYFTWQFDDDLYAPSFLESVQSTLVKFNRPPCVFTSYQIIRGDSHHRRPKPYSGTSQLFSGRQFLRLYLSGRIHTMGLTGVYDVEYLRRRESLEHLSNRPFALYSEYLLVIRCGLLEKVAYIGAPLVYYRVHKGSWGNTNTELETYRQTAANLVRRSVEVLGSPPLAEDFSQNVSAILRLLYYEFVDKSSQRSALSCMREAKQFWALLRSSIKSSSSGELYGTEILSGRRKILWFVVPFMTGRFKAGAPSGLVNLVFRILPIFQKRRFFNFR
jgi:glycosyltransferase involved in cell wall biosynthesis